MILLAVIVCTIAMVSISIQNAASMPKKEKDELNQATTALSDTKKEEFAEEQQSSANNQQNNANTSDTQNQQSSTSSVSGIAITYLSAEKTEFSMAVGDTVQLGATVYPQSEANKPVAWASSNTSVISVSDSGLVTAVGSGDAYIIVTCEGVQKQCKVYVW